MKRVLVALICSVPMPLLCATPSILDGYRAAAREENAAFKDFSAARGENLYREKRGDVACASCHGASPAEHGKHTATGKDILPMAPAANPERFTDAAKVEKWFRRNCNDVLKRPCTAQEKGDFITYLSTVR